MADSLTFEIKEYEDIRAEYPYWNAKFPIVDFLYRKGKDPIILHAHLAIDTLADAIGEIQDPTNDCLEFSTYKQVYLRSSNAADTSKSVGVIGQKSDGSFGLFALTTDDTDGTTPVDCGEWMCILGTIKVDTFAGNAILDDDGASSTVYFTMALGAAAGEGIIYTPSGYYASILEVKTRATDTAGFVPTDAADTIPDIVMVEIGDEVRNHIDLNHPISCDEGSKVFDQTEQIKIEAEFEAAVIPCYCDIYIVMWQR